MNHGFPQRAPIPAEPRYRLWDEDASRWIDFIEGADNTLEPAPGEPGWPHVGIEAAYVDLGKLKTRVAGME